MANTKEEIRKILDALPDDATWEDVQYSIYVRERVERGTAEAAEGKVIDQDQVETRMKRWLDE
jgi:predicted transcriptional regulator